MKKIVKALPFLVLISYIGFIFVNKSASFSDMGIIFALSALYGLRLYLSHKEQSMVKPIQNPEIEQLQIDIAKENLKLERTRKLKEVIHMQSQIKHQEEASDKPYQF